MSLDISIKPVGVPTASPFVASGSAARDGVPTQLPPRQTVTPVEAIADVRHDSQSLPSPVTNKVTIDKAAAAIVFQTVDDRTSEVIGQYPAESILRRRAYIIALDSAKADTKTDTKAEIKTAATDRTI